MPQTNNQLIIEGAGGLMVPLNNNFLMIDLIQQLDVDVVLVVKHYLGSINHTLLSLDALKNRGLNIKAIIFNGDADTYSEEVITAYAKCETIAIPDMQQINRATIAGQEINL